MPQYLKAFEVLFFITFLGLYYAVLIEQNFTKITASEITLYLFVAGSTVDEGMSPRTILPNDRLQSSSQRIHRCGRDVLYHRHLELVGYIHQLGGDRLLHLS